MLFLCDMGVKKNIQEQLFCFGILVKGKFEDSLVVGVALWLFLAFFFSYFKVN